MADQMRISTRRVGVVGGPAFFCVFGAFLALGEPDLGARIWWLAICAASGYFLFRAWQVGVELTDTTLLVKGQFRNHSIRWSDVAAARLEPMRTASPFKGQFPYLALAVDFADGRTKQFEEVSASEAESDPLRALVEEINRRIRAA